MTDKAEPATRVVIHRRKLRGSDEEDVLQKLATVYVGTDEYRLYAPAAAEGDSLDWLDHVYVHRPDPESPGSEIEVGDHYGALAIKATREALGEERSEREHAPSRFYHVRLHVAGESDVEVKFDLGYEELEKRVLEPYRNLRPIVLSGRTILPGSLVRIEIYEAGRPSSELQEFTKTLARQVRPDWSFAEPDIRDVTDELISTPSLATLPTKSDAIELLCLRFHAVSMQMRDRHEARPTLDVADEYDVQDLLHALLRIFFDDVRPEEWTPSYAGKSSRMDFLLPAEETVIEVKKTRPGLGAKELGDQLIVDIARYKTHPSCKRLVCFVYDPEGRIANPRGIERDLSQEAGEFEVEVIIAPNR